MNTEILQIGAVAVIFFFAIKEFFAWLGKRKESNAVVSSNGGDGLFNLIFQEVQKMNSNHLHSIQEAIEKGFRDHSQSEHEDNMRIIEILGEIKGLLSRR